MEWNPASKRGKKKKKNMMLTLFVGILQSVPA
jgi:hypothetical protein